MELPLHRATQWLHFLGLSECSLLSRNPGKTTFHGQYKELYAFWTCWSQSTTCSHESNWNLCSHALLKISQHKRWSLLYCEHYASCTVLTSIQELSKWTQWIQGILNKLYFCLSFYPWNQDTSLIRTFHYSGHLGNQSLAPSLVPRPSSTPPSSLLLEGFKG